MIDLIRRAWEAEDRGVAMVWLATTIVLLLGTAGFAVDLGWLYLNASRAQRTVDSAAMAGVVHLPGFPNSADGDARDTARANGYDVCNVGISGCADTLTSTPLSDSELLVELDTNVNSFFLSVLGFDSFDISREATAEYLKPVPLGSPDQCFGYDPTGTYCAASDASWAAIQAPYTSKEYGDPYSTRCLVGDDEDDCDSSNPDYARGGAYNGYYYAIEVASGSSNLGVHVYDARFNDRNSAGTETGDFDLGSDEGPHTNFQLYAVDSTPHDPTDNPAISGCDWSLAPDSNNFYKNRWRTLCNVGGSLTPGVYVLHVWTSGDGVGSNHYSVAATTNSGPDPKVYGINDMSIWSNNLTATSTLWLAEVDSVHAGKKFDLQFFDAGDANGDSWMTVYSPLGTIPTCSWEVWNHDQSVLESTGSGACTWQTTIGGNRQYNNKWITAVVDLPDNPADLCGSDCFWYMDLNLSQPTERTTWKARVVGNPVRLVP